MKRTRNCDTPFHAIDAEVGRRIRQRRIELGISQERLGALIGLTFQQVQKYEKGTNRVSASRLAAIATALGCPVAFFFDEANDTAALAPGRMSIEMVRAFAALPEGQRRAVYELVKALARGDAAAAESAAAALAA